MRPTSTVSTVRIILFKFRLDGSTCKDTPTLKSEWV